jgi:4a-hydroxytetrahydrobiopterin dehydratase
MILNLARIQEKMSHLSGWSLDGDYLTKEMTFSGFMKALEYVNKVSEVADRYKHFPDVIILFSTVRLTLIDRKEHGLTDVDFEVAQEIDKIKME